MITARSEPSGRAPSSEWAARPALDQPDEERREPLDHGSLVRGGLGPESGQLADEAEVERRPSQDAREVRVERGLDLLVRRILGVDGIGDLAHVLVDHLLEQRQKASVAIGEVLVEGAARRAGDADDVSDRRRAEALLLDRARQRRDQAVAVVLRATMTRPPRLGIIVTLRCRGHSDDDSARYEIGPLGDRSEHQLLLGHGQRGTEAAADSAAERDPGVRARLCVEEALGLEPLRVRVHVGPMVQRRDADRDRRLGRDDVVAQSPRLLHQPDDDRDHRADAHALVDGGLDVGVGLLFGAVSGQLSEPLVGLRCAHEALEGPSERVRGRLMTGEHERHQLVPHLFIRQGLPVLVARLEQQRHHIGGAFGDRLRPPGPDRPVQLTVGELQHPRHRAARLLAAQVVQLDQSPQQIGRDSQQATEGLAHAVLGRALGGRPVDPEQPAHDHVERDRLHPRGQRERLADLPPVDFAVSHVSDG